MDELEHILAELDLSIYLCDFLENGFDTWETILDIKESDFDTLGVKLGHRRKLQRKIANSKGWPSDRALETPGNTGDNDCHLQKASGLAAEAEDSCSRTAGTKRKYVRHPKPDKNAPGRPLSAYVIFSNQIREKNIKLLSFTEIAKLAGKSWQHISPTEKKIYEQQAFIAKERYTTKLAEYITTDSYKEYARYLEDFKARQSLEQHTVNDLETPKRLKLEVPKSTASYGTTNSSNTQHEMNVSSQSLNMPKLNIDIEDPGRQSSLGTTSRTVLPRYRESIYCEDYQSAPWEGQHNRSNSSPQFLPQVAMAVDRRASHTGSSATNHFNLARPVQYSHQTKKTPLPLPLTSESTNRSSISPPGISSSALFSPITQVEPLSQRVMPIPPIYPQNAFRSIESQLLHLRPGPLSPQTTTLSAQPSPQSVYPVDFPIRMAPLHTNNYTMQHSSPINPKQRNYKHFNRAQDNLDPVNALLKAGEIICRNSKGHSRS